MRKPTPQEKEMAVLTEQLETFENSMTNLSPDINHSPKKEEREEQTKLSQKEIANSKDIYLKPVRSIGTNIKFNETYRKDYEFDKEYVQFIAENYEIIGEAIEMWTKKYPGQPAEFWKVPVNKPVWGPRYLAEQIKGCSYRRLRTEDRTVTSTDSVGQFTGQLVVDSTVQRLDARPVHTKRSIFSGVGGF